MTPLERQFHKECLDGSETLRKLHKYNPTYFSQMVHEHGGVGAVRLLLKSPNFQDGLTSLWEIGQLDFSIEVAVLNPKWSSLFTLAEKREAKKRLTALGYTPKFTKNMTSELK
jgi:hypothetical protein